MGAPKDDDAPASGSELRRIDTDVRESVEQAGGVFDRLEQQLDRETRSELSSDVTWTVSRKVVVHRDSPWKAYLRGGVVALVGAAALVTVVGVSMAAGVLLDRSAHDQFTEQSEPQLSPEAKRAIYAALGSGGLASAPIGTAFPGGGLTSSGQDRAFFEMAPMDGAGGFIQPCACVTPSGLLNGLLTPMTFTRASTAWCSKASETTGIVAGDLVECGTGLARVMPGGNGSGGNGLAVWEARTNLMLRSIEPATTWTFEAGTTAVNNSPACPVAPDGTQTMGLVTFAGASGKGFYQGAAVTGGLTITNSIYVTQKTGGAACVLNLNDGFTAGAGTTLVVPSGSYARGAWTLVSAGGVGGLYLKEVTAGDCTDACVWQMQTEIGTTASSPITTAGTTATRVAEVAEVDLGASAPLADSFSAAATRSSGLADNALATSTNGYTAASKISATDVSFAGWTLNMATAGVPRSRAFNDALTPFATGTTTATNPTNNTRFSGWATGGFVNGIYNGTALTQTAITGVFSPARYFMIGQVGRTLWGNGVVKNVCYSPDPLRCR